MSLLKPALPALVIAAAVFPSQFANAQDMASDTPPFGEFSANVGVYTDYIYRGISQTDEGPAIQGGFDWAHDSGLYAGVWGSNVDFNDGDEANIEIDYYAGFANSFEGFHYDVSGIYYSYPGAADALDYDFFEVAGALGYDFGVADVTGSVAWSPDFFGGIGDAVYYKGEVAVPLPYGFGIDGHVGHQDFDNAAAVDYTDWSVGLTYAVWGFDLDLRYYDTDLSSTACADGCDERVVFGISRSF
ncbi:MAG: hypothetical protein CMM50_04070 [Rhodospirillaceae bacterium]|nr:hypothetical protein [Rhodospirillaceae bacterium]